MKNDEFLSRIDELLDGYIDDLRKSVEELDNEVSTLTKKQKSINIIVNLFVVLSFLKLLL